MSFLKGSEIRAARKQKKLTIVQVAKSAGFSTGFLSMLENNLCQSISVGRAQILTDLLDLPSGFFGDAIFVDTDPLDGLVEEYDLPIEHELKMRDAATTLPVYRGSVVAERNTMEWYGKFYNGIKPYLPPVEKIRLDSSAVEEMLQQAGIESRGDLSAILDEIEDRFSPEGILDAKTRATKICGEMGVVIKRLKDEDKDPNCIEKVKQWCVERGLYNVIGELFLYDESPDLLGGTYPIHGGDNPKERYLILSDLRGRKKAREEFTFWHELAHILLDPELKKAPVWRGSGFDVKEWFIDHVAARLAFPRKIFQPIVKMAYSVSEGGLPTMRLAQQIKDTHAPLASRQMVTRMIVNYWPGPLVYLEGILRLKKNERSGPEEADHLSSLAKLRVCFVQMNSLAKETMPDIPRNFRIPESSIVFAAHEAFRGEAVLGPQKESFSRWTSSTGQSLGDGDYWVSACAEPDQDTLNSQAQRIRAYAFLTTTNKEGRPNE